jgi:hypothetical protein
MGLTARNFFLFALNLGSLSKFQKPAPALNQAYDYASYQKAPDLSREAVPLS